MEANRKSMVVDVRNRRELLENISALPYVNCYPTDGRQLLLMSYKGLDGCFHVPIVFPDGKFFDMRPAGIVDGAYASTSIDDVAQDLHSPLLTTIFQSLSFGELFEPYQKLQADILNAAALIEKYFLLLRHYGASGGSGYRTVLGTEFESLLMNQRAMYDQLQFFMKMLWKLVIQPKKQSLPGSFADLAVCSNEDLIRKFNLPDALRKFVLQTSKTFGLVRTVRTGIEHHGKTARDFFVFSDGFAVPIREWPWSEFPIWDGCPLKPNELGSYLRLLSWSTLEAMQAVDGFERAIRTDIPFPSGQISKWSIYLRSPHNAHLAQLQSYFDHPWRDAKSRAIESSANSSVRQ